MMDNKTKTEKEWHNKRAKRKLYSLFPIRAFTFAYKCDSLNILYEKKVEILLFKNFLKILFLLHCKEEVDFLSCIFIVQHVL